jgi:GT2 family glycosyltransferase
MMKAAAVPIGPAAPAVSVIVPVRHDAAGCRALVEALGHQSLPADRFEILIGSDGPPMPAVAALATPDGRVRVLAGAASTSYAARNRAAAAAEGAALAFCDTDCLPDPDWLAEGLAALAAADLAGGQVIYRAPNHPTVWSRLTTDLFLDQERNIQRSRAVTANLFVTRAAVLRIGGFDGSLPSGGDFAFAQAAAAEGLRLVYAPRAIVRHPTMDAPRAFFRKVWRTNRWSAVRRRREGGRVPAAVAFGILPIAGSLLVRRQTLRHPLRLDRGRLEAAGIRTTGWDEAAAMALVHLVVMPAANVARLAGWLDRRLRRRRRRAADGPAPRSGSSASAR